MNALTPTVLLIAASISCAVSCGGDANDSGTEDTTDPDTGGSADGLDEHGNPEPVSVQLGDCAAWTPCGGNPEGKWAYTSACVREEQTGLSALATVCPAATVGLSGTVSGTLTFADGLVTRNGSWAGQAELTLPDSCTAAVGGCSRVEPLLNTMAPTSGWGCSEQGDKCHCTLAMQGDDLTTEAYTVDGHTLNLEESGRAMEYCVTGDSLAYEETSGAEEPGTYGLTAMAAD
ncbi:hypothetical protein ACFL5O_03320 [Myxococcota bacterium]